MTQIISDLPQIRSSAPLALSGQRRTDSSHVSFFSRYDLSDWSGELFAYAIDPATGLINLSTPVWAAHDLLDRQPWADRKVGSYSGTRGVAFAKIAEGGLTPEQLAKLNSPAGTDDHAGMIAFLRGDRSGEYNPRLGTGAFRKRAGVLGDNINAAPLFVSVPKARYIDDGYLEFKAAANATGQTRPDMVYLGTNDGMLHAFNAASGRESWAYVPGLLINQPYVVNNPPISYPERSALVNLSMRTGFTHLYYADGTPVSGDVDLNNTGAAASGAAWRLRHCIRGVPSAGLSTCCGRSIQSGSRGRAWRC